MRTTKEWGLCQCNCGRKIKAGTEMKIVDGEFFIAGHEESKNRFYNNVDKIEEPKRYLFVRRN